MPNVYYSRHADRALDAIWDYIAKDNRIAAASVLRAIARKAQLVATNPMIGVARPELADQLRSISEGHYVIFYRPITDGIEILHVIHDARDIDASFT